MSPIPTPNKNESKKEFISRCLSNKNIKKEFGKGTDKAIAVCNSQWRNKQMVKFNYEVPIKERSHDKDEFLIQGTAINATTTTNNHKFISEELESAAGSLSGVPLLIDHENKVKNIKGRVLEGNFDKSDQKIDFKAKVQDKEMQEMIKDGRIRNVSVGCAVEELEEGEEGVAIPRGIRFQELSLVAVPADNNASFTVALSEAAKSIKEDQESNSKKLKGGKKMSEDNQEKQPDKSESDKSEEESEKSEEESEDNEEAEESAILKEIKALHEDVKSNAKELKNLKEDDKDEESEESEEEAEEEEDSEEEESEENDEAEEKVELEDKNYSLVESKGSLKGGSFTIVR